jgi:hypothetical protein
MKKVFLLLFLACSFLDAKQLGVVLVSGKGMNFAQQTADEITTLMGEQNEYYVEKNSVDVIVDKAGTLKRDLKRKGVDGLVSFAQSKKWDSIVMVEYKRSLKRLQIKLVVADEIKDRKSVSLRYTDDMQTLLSEMLLSNVIRLNYQLGVINAKELY